MPPIFVPFVYLYSSNPKIPNSQKSKQLKKSLSETLSRYYPLAGRHIGNLYVDCNDGGVPFSEAQADCDLSQVITNQNLKNSKKFLPNYKIEEPQDLCMAVRATYFRCGGFAIGILISHKITDGASSILFVNTRSAVARGEDGGGVLLPKFDAAAYFWPLDIPSAPQPAIAITKEEVAARIFTFPASKIAALRERYSSPGGGRPTPSRVEALSAFIWTRFMSATGKRSDPDKISTVRHSVNLRSRADPPLSEYHYGHGGFPYKNTFSFMDAKSGGGIEALIHLSKHDVEKFEADLELQMMLKSKL